MEGYSFNFQQEDPEVVRREVAEAASWTPADIRAHHARLLDAEASELGMGGPVYDDLKERARIARADAEALRRGEEPSTPPPPAFRVP